MSISHPRGFDVHAAHSHVARDRKFARWLTKIEPIAPDPRWQAPFDPVDALARAILYQQLSGKAAATIVGRVEKAIASEILHADTLSRVDDETLRGCGVSGNKVRALRDLSERAAHGDIPSMDDMAGLSSDAIVAALTPVRGIGRWTVEMMLIFRLGRPDVLPIDDLGVRKGAQQIDRLTDLPTAKALDARGARWAPFRSYAALALWRIADLGNAAAKPTKRSQE
ncbi:DNA-3-methyladenine glycosylase 2 family protein [Xanthomonadaceae bacterium XH05]|nr:DNA-3-methyladenine glycosylase 2 family protein [Xanthomonadaceae bacterium XH05]